MRPRFARFRTSTDRRADALWFDGRPFRNRRLRPARALVLLLVGLLLAAPAAEARQRGGPPGLTPQIVGGTAARPGDYPFMVSLQIRYRGRWRHNCGGTLLDATHVLTAAHCVTTSSGGVVAPSVYRAVVGRDRLGSSRGRAIPVAAIVRDPAFDPETLLNDAAVLTLARPWAAAEDSPGWGSVLLPTAGDASRDQPGQDAIAAGWGSTVQQDGVLDLPRHLANRLQWVALLIDDGDACAAKYDGTGWAVVDPALNLCASYPSKDACQGDSGGPLLVRSAVAGLVSYEQVGIVSSGRGCAWPGWPGVYTRLSAPAIRQFVACAVETGAACP